MRRQATAREPTPAGAGASTDVSTVVPAGRLSRGARTRAPLAVATLLLLVAAAWVAAPLWVGLMLGTVMAFTAQPLQEKLTARFGKRSGAAALVTTLLGGLAMAGGGAAALLVVAREVVKIVSVFEQRLASGSSFDLLGARVTKALLGLGVAPDRITLGLRSELGKLSAGAAGAAGVVLQTTAGALLTLVVALWTMYYALLGWPGLERRLELLLPLDAADVRALTREFRDVGRSAFVATLGCAVVQGVLAAIGFALAGIPEPVTWSVLLAITSFAPVVGTAVVWIPAGFYLLATGHPAKGVFEWTWGALVVMAATDYVIRPRLVGKQGHTHPLLTLISLIGGVLAFGLPGLVAGPVIVSLFAATVRIYERDLARRTPPA